MALLAALLSVPEPLSAGATNRPPVGKLVATLSPPDTNFTADFTDPDGDALTYTWQARIECGTFLANSPQPHQAVWRHPSGEPPAGCPHQEGTDHTGTVTVIVSEQGGGRYSCSHEGSGSGEDSCTVYGEDLDECTLNFRLFDGQGGSRPSDENEDRRRGAFTVRNGNDTDDRGGRDLGQESVAGESDLMRLRLFAPQPDQGGKVRLEIPQGANRVAFYRRSTKGQRLTPDPDLEFLTAELPLTLWVEGRRPSRAVRDVALEYSYHPPQADGPCRDTARATIVWAELAGVRHDADQRIFGDMPARPRDLLERLCGGLGLRPPGPSPRGIRNCIAFQFQIAPPGIRAETDVRFDIARQKYSDFSVVSPDGRTTYQEDHSTIPPGDEANDDGHNEDESSRPTTNEFFYSFDGPGTPNPETRPHVRAFYDARFREFVRVRFDDERPSGNRVSGTVASPKVRWDASHRWASGARGVLRRTTGDDNETDHNFVSPR